MSIVSRLIDTQAPLAKKARVVGAVRQKSALEAPPQFSLPAQKPFFNLGAKAMKPVSSDEKDYKIGVVPLKSLQHGSHAKGASLFNAPVAPAMMPLKVPVYHPTVIEGDMSYEVDVPFPTHEFGQSIRPSVRDLIFSPIEAPSAPTYRPSGGGMATTRQVDVGYYDDGMDVLFMQVKGRIG